MNANIGHDTLDRLLQVCEAAKQTAETDQDWHQGKKAGKENKRPIGNIFGGFSASGALQKPAKVWAGGLVRPQPPPPYGPGPSVRPAFASLSSLTKFYKR